MYLFLIRISLGIDAQLTKSCRTENIVIRNITFNLYDVKSVSLIGYFPLSLKEISTHILDYLIRSSSDSLGWHGVPQPLHGKRWDFPHFEVIDVLLSSLASIIGGTRSAVGLVVPSDSRLADILESLYCLKTFAMLISPI